MSGPVLRLIAGGNRPVPCSTARQKEQIRQRILAALYRHDDDLVLTCEEIADALGVVVATVAGHLSQLRRDGRIRHSDDWPYWRGWVATVEVRGASGDA